jgi:gamma-glutamylcyclotransferase (GGCT)/AIG2-like uncharacterized protein YtfP
MKRMGHLVFVYGTLKRDQANHLLLEDESFRGEATTARDYTMGNAGFPVALSARVDTPVGKIRGEVYRVGPRTMRALDKLENEGQMYHRTVVPIIHNGQERQALMYVGSDNYWKDMRYYRPHVDQTFNWPHQPA